MTGDNQVEKCLNEQMVDLLKRKPQNNDVTFTVGQAKVKVGAVKFILKAASPIFEKEFEDTWEKAILEGGENEILLPDIDPKVFELFIKLIVADTWSVETLNCLKLPPNLLFSLHGLCRRYEITKGVRNLEAVAVLNVEEVTACFIESFEKYKDTDRFLRTSPEVLKFAFSSEDIPLNEVEIFECACRWAEYQCKQKELELTGENFRKVLGSSFYEIRFPLMKIEDFIRVSRSKRDIFTADEKLAIYDFIGMDGVEKINCDKSQIRFKTIPRIKSWPFACLDLDAQDEFKITTDPPFECDGNVNNNSFQLNQNISLYGIGFLGPIDGDEYYDVTVQIRGWANERLILDTEKLAKNIFASKGKVFRFFFDNPITIQANLFDVDWRNGYIINYSLKGASSVSQFIAATGKDETFEVSGVKFTFHWTWNSKRPLTELLYKKI